MNRRFAAALLAAAFSFAAVPAAAAASDDFKTLLDEHYAWLLSEAPTYATALGVREHDARIEDLSLAAADRRAERAAAFLKRLDAVPDAALGASERTSKAILRRALSETVEANGFPQRLMLFTTYAGWHQNFAGMANGLPFRTRADYESYLTRLEQYPRLNDEALKITAQAVAEGQVLPCSVLGNMERSITGVIAEDPLKSRFYEPFLRSRPGDVPEAEWAALQARAQRIVREVLNPAYGKHAQFYRTSYAPRCAKSDSVSSLPGGREYYAFRVRQETTTTLTPDQIHQLGLAESRRINAEMDAVAKGAGFPSRQAYIQELRTDPDYFARSPEELMRATARVAKTIDGKMPAFFRTLPRLPYGIREIPAEIAEGTTTAYYGQGAPESGIAGTYYVNTSKLNQRPLWEIPALSAHEAVPGHHQQISLQQELELPPFRRHFTSFTAFTEGWGLYSEKIAEEMGLYDTPARKMGQLSYQAWRAARLVVDTGIHAKGWDKARAVAFMRENTALSHANIDAEVNRYISWPGQALGYKIGELKIRELRARAEKALGARFDVRRFHDAVLLQGSVPLDVLEAQIGAWIEAEKQRA
jgi:uncharacterized protein (DUF885 family)